MARHIPEERYDVHGPVRLMAQAAGYRMVRRPGCMPFVLTDREWAALFVDPVPPVRPLREVAAAVEAAGEGR